MKERTLFKKAALTAAVSLALAQSVWAMPTGGTVAHGDVTVNNAAFTGGDLTDGANVVANAASIINWDAFGIAAGEILNFNTANGALLNRVTGSLRSDIFGTLTQTGAHPMFLVNPNGILVGNGATINANSLVFSTLAISNDDFMNGATGHLYTFTKPTGKTIAEPLQFHGKNTTVTIGETLKALGGTVEVADGVTFVANSAADINLVAAETVGGKLASTSALSMTGTKDNAVSVTDSTLGTQGRVYLQGGELDVTNSTVTGKEVYLRAAESFVPGKSQDSKNATVAIKNSSIKATKDDNGIQDGIGRSFIVGGNVTIAESNIHGIENVRAFEGWDYGENGYPTYTTDAGHEVAVKGSTLNSARRVRLQGGTVSVSESSKLEAPLVQLWAQNQYVNAEDIGADETNAAAQNLAPLSADNTVAVTGSTLGSNGNIHLLGGKISLKDSNVNSGSTIEMFAMPEYSHGDMGNGASEDNTLSIDNSQLAGDFSLNGGVVTVSNRSTIKAKYGDNTDGSVASQSPKIKGAKRISVSDSQVETNGWLRIVSDKVALDNAEINAESLLIAEYYDKVGGYSTAADSLVSLDGTTITTTGGEIAILDGAIDIKDSNLSSGAGVDFLAFAHPDQHESVPGTRYHGIAAYTMDANNTIKMNNADISAKGEIYLTGGKVDIVNSTLDSAGASGDNLVILAAESAVTYKNTGDSYQMGDAPHGVTLTDTELKSAQDAYIAGRTVTLDNVKLTSEKNTAVAAVQNVEIPYDTNMFSGSTSAGNTVSMIGGSTVSAANKLAIGGREVSVTDKSTVSVGAENGLSVKAGEKGTMKDYVITVEGASGEIAVSTDSALLQNGADIADAIATSRPTPTPAPDPTPTPTPNPDPAPTPEIPTARTVAENVENGKTAMSTVLANNATVETRKSGVKMLIESINQSTASGAVKSAKISGVFLAILDDKSLTDAEKASLQREIVQTFHPTQIANAEANNTIDNASQAGASAAAGDTQPKNTERTFPEEEMPIVKGL